MMFVYRIRLSLTIALLSVLAVSELPARASFVPFTPTACPTMTEVNYAWSALDTAQGFEAHYVSPTSLYHNNQTTERFFLTNPRVRDAGFYVTTRDFYSGGADYLVMSQAGGTQTTIDGISGTDYWANVASTSLRVPIKMNFATNSSIGGTGFTITKFRFCGGGTPANTVTPIVTERRYQGVLLATDDVVLMSVLGPAVGKQVNIALWPGPSGASNADLYVRCAAIPTFTTYMKRSTLAFSEEFLSVSNAECPAPSTIFIGVHSTSGVGGFNLLASRANTSANKTLRIASEGATPTELNTIRSTLREAARRLYGASDGQVMISHIDLVNVLNGSIAATHASCKAACQAQFGVNCDACFAREAGSSFAEVPGNTVLLAPAWADPPITTHEWGHSILGVLDEYVSGSNDPKCGHSTMATPWGCLSFCMDVQYSNHNLDPFNGAPPVAFDSVWTEALLIGTDPGVTPDWYSFADHDSAGNPSITTF